MLPEPTIWEILDPPLYLLAHIQLCHFLKACDKRVWPLLQASILNGGAKVVIFEIFGNSWHTDNMTSYKQECIPVGCVPPASVAVLVCLRGV